MNLVSFYSAAVIGSPIIALQPGSNGNVLAVGSENGLIRIFDTRRSFKVDINNGNFLVKLFPFMISEFNILIKCV